MGVADLGAEELLGGEAGARPGPVQARWQRRVGDADQCPGRGRRALCLCGQVAHGCLPMIMPFIMRCHPPFFSSPHKVGVGATLCMEDAGVPAVALDAPVPLAPIAGERVTGPGVVLRVRNGAISPNTQGEVIYEFQLDTTADFQAPQSAEVPRNAGGETSVMFDIGLEEVGDGIWNIVYYTTLLGKRSMTARRALPRLETVRK